MKGNFRDDWKNLGYIGFDLTTTQATKVGFVCYNSETATEFTPPFLILCKRRNKDPKIVDTNINKKTWKMLASQVNIRALDLYYMDLDPELEYLGKYLHYLKEARDDI